MLFNSIDFAIFFPIVFFIYWFLSAKHLKWQNFVLLVASYLFYGWWDWRFLLLILFSSLIDFTIGKKLGKTAHEKTRYLLLYTSLLVNLGLLFFFKYYHFFVDNFVAAFVLFGTPLDAARLNIILPIGISFYTFQTLSYTIDVFRRKLQPTNDLISFLAFVSFFPQLVAGPIERATNLLPQFYKKRQFSYEKATDGMRQILWGLLKKMVIADNCAIFVNEIFGNADNHSGGTLLIGAVLFAFQIYGDFSGYSDIAIGTAKILGFDLMKNFANPYFSRDIAEFWRRWHISLSTWFRDYLYIPLGGSRGSINLKIRNTFIIFLVSGFWHGANWTFIVWGGLNALYFLPLLLSKKNRVHLNVVAQSKYLPSLREVFNMLITFSITVIAWIFFRADNLSHAFAIISTIFSYSLFQFTVPAVRPEAIVILPILVLFFLIEWFGRELDHTLKLIEGIPTKIGRLSVYYCLAMALFLFSGKEQEFIYFQF